MWGTGWIYILDTEKREKVFIKIRIELIKKDVDKLATISMLFDPKYER